MNMELEHYGFLQWYPAMELMASLTTTRRLHRWTVNQLPNPEARYQVITRAETPQELTEREAEE